MAFMELKGIRKKYDNNQAYTVHDFNLDIDKGEFIVFVGPSGCGKSTTLRMIAGLEEITEGQLLIEGERMNDQPPKDRKVAMVFQSYALFPFLSVYENIGFGLKIRKEEKAVRDEKIRRASAILGLDPYLEKKPADLSGGQRQRVALGRAIVNEAPVFLMDEPLSNLDAKLRGQMREEIVRIHRQVGATTVYVTHDQIEAMTMGDRIVVLKDGHIMQVGTPEEIYNEPANAFVASFIGTPPMNFFEGDIHEGGLHLKDGQRLCEVTDELAAGHSSVTVGIRPETVELADSGLAAQVERAELLGADYNLHVKVDGNRMIVRRGVNDGPFAEGDRLHLRFPLASLYLFDKASGARL